MHMIRIHGNGWLLLNREFYEYGTLPLLVCEYAASNLPKELWWHKPQAKMLTPGYGRSHDFLPRRLTCCLQRGDPMDVSLSIVPQSHTLLPPRNLEAEASGLLDRMLAVFQENSTYVSSSSPCHQWLTRIAMLFSLTLRWTLYPPSFDYVLQLPTRSWMQS